MTRLLTPLGLLLALALPAWAATETVQGPVTIMPLDVSTVTTGGVAVTALAAGRRTGGGWIYNPAEATTSLCISEVGVASGTVSQGNVTCIAPGSTFGLSPTSGPVSVISSDSAHPFSGFGYQ